ncbi:UNVERIFIED_CONTAM: hypothetical protein HDU68_004529 [Siphonaria sp. JEL0065]|nr:hypothetical protein HDU68_004529 [Siphonaria sp. JEL0065]
MWKNNGGSSNHASSLSSPSFSFSSPSEAPSVLLAADAGKVKAQLEANEQRIRLQHLGRILAQTQEQVRTQQTEITVLKKALVDYSSLSLDANMDTFASTTATTAASRDALVASLTAELNDARAQISNKQWQIDQLTTSLEAAKRDLQNTKEDLESTRNELRETNTRGSTLVDAMLVRASAPAASQPLAEKKERGRSKARKDSSTQQQRKQNQSRLFNHTISSKNKNYSPPSTTSKTQSTTNSSNAGRTVTMTAPHTFNPHPSSSKHARSHSYDSYLKQLMASKPEYQSLHPQNIECIRNQAHMINRSLPEHQQPPSIQTKSFKSNSKEFKVVTIQEEFNSTAAIPCANNNRVPLMCDGLSELKWLDLPSASVAHANASELSTMKRRNEQIPFQYPTAIFDSNPFVPPQNNLKTTTKAPSTTSSSTSSKELTVQALSARAIAAEMERDALEEELLSLMKKLNQQKERERKEKEKMLSSGNQNSGIGSNAGGSGVESKSVITGDRNVGTK